MDSRPPSRWGWWAAAGLALVLTPFLAPWIYRALVSAGWVDPTDTLGGDPFGKVLRRVLLVPVALVVLGALRPWRDVGLTDMGLAGPASRPRAGLLAWALTVLAIAALLVVHGLLGWLAWEVNEPLPRVGYRLVKTLVSGAAIATIEEWIFRAWLPLVLARRVRPGAAAALAVLSYAAIHAFRATHLKDAVEVSPGGVLAALGVWLGTLVDPRAFGPSFLGLALFGALLLRLYRRARTLWVPIGVHAASIWVLFAYGAVSERGDTPAWAGTKVLYDGPLGWALLLLALALAWRPRRPLLVLALLACCAAPVRPGAIAADEPAPAPADERERLLAEARRLASKAELYLRGGRPTEVVAEARRAWELRVRLLGPEHADALASLSLLAQVLSGNALHAEALGLQRRVVEARTRLQGAEHADTGTAHGLLGTMHFSASEPAAALAHVTRGLEILERARGPEHAEVGDLLLVAGAIHEELGDYGQALARLRRAVEIFSRIADPARLRLGNARRVLANALLGSGDPEAARAEYARALELFERSPMRPILLAGRTRIGLGHALLQLGRHAEARALLEPALEHFEKAFGPDHDLVGLILGHLGTLYLGLGEYARAQATCERALARAQTRFGPEDLSVASAMNNLAHVHQVQGRYAQARALLLRALAIQERSAGPTDLDVAHSVNNLGHLAQTQGAYDEARVRYEQALTIWTRRLGPDHPRVATGLNNLAVLLDLTGSYAEALPLYERAAQIRRTSLGPSHPLLARCLNNLGVTLGRLGKERESRACYEEALAIYERAYGPGALHPDATETLNNLSLALSGGPEPDRARAATLLENAIAAKTRALGSEHPSLAVLLQNLAALHDARGDDVRARALLERALALSERLGPEHPEVAQRLDLLAQHLLRSGAPREAAAHARRAVAVAEAALRRSFGGVEAALRPAFVATLRGALSTWLAASPHVGDPGYAEVLRIKGIALRATAAERRLLREGGPEARARAEELAAAERALARSASAVPAEAAGLEAWRAEYAEAAARRQRLALELARASAPVRAAQERLDLGLSDVRARLPPGGVLADFLRDEERYLVWVVGASGEPLRLDLGPAEPIEQAVAEAVAAFARASAGGDDVPGEDGAAHALARLVVEPWRARLPEGTRAVVLCPDAALALLPFAALPLGDAGRTLGEALRLTQVAMAQDLVPHAAAPAAGAGALVAGGVEYGPAPAGRKAAFEPLPWTRVEAETVAARVGDRAPLLGASATEGALRERVVGRALLHLATHGFVKDDPGRGLRRRGADAGAALGAELERHVAAGRDPLLLAGLALAGANGDGTGEDDGILTAAEASHLNLSACRLVVLSACTTARGKTPSGEGVVGLVQGFQLAGAGQVLGSLWKVDDEATQALMARFYALWPGVPASDALRQAQAHVRAQERWRAPTYWAAWVLWGADS